MFRERQVEDIQCNYASTAEGEVKRIDRYVLGVKEHGGDTREGGLQPPDRRREGVPWPRTTEHDPDGIPRDVNWPCAHELGEGANVLGRNVDGGV